MNTPWDNEYLTVKEIAEHLKLNQQTVRNWIDAGSLPAVRIGRRVRVPRAELDRILAQSATVTPDPQPSLVAPADAREQLTQALEHAQRLLGRRSAARRAELAQELQQLSDAVATVVQMLSDGSGAPPNDAADDADADSNEDAA